MRIVVAVWRLALAGLIGFAVHDLATASGFGDMVFFTNQSCVAAGFVILWAGLATLLRGQQPPRALKGGVTLYLIITALVSALILDPEPAGNPQVFLGFTQTGLKHVLIPALVVADFVFCDRHGKFRWTFPSWWLIYPVCYMVFTTVRGAIWPDLGYPYGFIDVAELGYAGLAQNVLLYGAGFWVLGALVVWVDRLLPARWGWISSAR